MTASLREFLEILFPSLEGEYIEVRLLNGSFPFSPKFFKSVDSLVSELPMLKELPGHNVYFGVCPRGIESGTKEAVSRILHIPLNSSGLSDFKSSGHSDSIRQLLTPPKILTL